MLKDKALRPIGVIVTCLALASLASSQQPKAAPPAPVPAQITGAKKVFVSNAGGVSFGTVFEEVVFSGGPDRPYNQFYDAMKTWGRYEMVATPADADVILKVRWALSDTGLKLPVLGQLDVEITDPKTNATLWTMDEYVRGAILLGNRDKNFDRAMNTIVDRMKRLVEPPALVTDASAK
jgi:hypothetical protein